MAGSRERCTECRAQFRVPASTPDERRCARCRREAAEPSPAPRAGRSAVGPVEAAVLLELGALGRDRTALGVLALRLAHEADRSIGRDVATLSRELRDTLTAATAGAAAAADRLDEIARRRREKIAAAQ